MREDVAMRILLLGGTHFVGYELSWALLKDGHDVSIVSLDPPRSDLRPHVDWILVDRHDHAALQNVLLGRTYNVVIDNIAFFPDDVRGLLSALSYQLDRYILTSTTDCYAKHTPRTWAEFELDVKCYSIEEINGSSNPYSAGKLSCEAVLREAGIPWTVIRVAPVTGVRDNVTGGFVPRGLHAFEESARSHFWPPRVLDGGPVLFNEEDENVIKLVWVADVAKAVCLIIRNEASINNVYNVCGDEFWTNERIVTSLADCAGVRPSYVYAPAEEMAAAGLDYISGYGVVSSWSLSDNAKLRAIGWNPTPPTLWMPALLEAYGRAFRRTGYHTRVKEVALARRIQSRESRNGVPGPARMDIIDSEVLVEPVARSPGQLTAAASKEWRDRIIKQSFRIRPAAWAFNSLSNGVLSRVGLGTAHGHASDDVDSEYVATLVHAGLRGINVFDTAINYRAMRSERTVGRAIARLMSLGFPRETFMVCSKGGMITADSQDQRPWEEFIRHEFVDPGIINKEEQRDLHALSGAIVQKHLAISLDNLALDMIDVYFLHNPEMGRIRYSAADFEKRLFDAFLVLEEAVIARRIGHYGLATWDGLRLPSSDPQHLSLEWVLGVAARAAQHCGNQKHSLRTIQLPLNAFDHRSLTLPTQRVRSQIMPALDAIKQLGLYSVTSGTVMQGGGAPGEFWKKVMRPSPGLSYRAALLRIAISSQTVGTALVGMRQAVNVEDAIAVMARPQLTSDELQLALMQEN